MTDTVTVNNITPPRVPLVDNAGTITRPWFMWFLNMFSRANLTDADIADLFNQVAGIAVSPRPPEFILPDYVGPAPFVPLVPTGLTTQLVSVATASQQLTNVDTAVNFDTDQGGAFGNIRRVGNNFICSAAGTYLFIFEPQVRQDKNNNKTWFWLTLNGVAINNSATLYEAAAINDTNVVSLTLSGRLAMNDVIQFRSITSQSVGSTLLYSAAAPPVPGVLAVLLNVLGFQK